MEGTWRKGPVDNMQKFPRVMVGYSILSRIVPRGKAGGRNASLEVFIYFLDSKGKLSRCVLHVKRLTLYLTAFQKTVLSAGLQCTRRIGLHGT